MMDVSAEEPGSAGPRREAGAEAAVGPELARWIRGEWPLDVAVAASGMEEVGRAPLEIGVEMRRPAHGQSIECVRGALFTEQVETCNATCLVTAGAGRLVESSEQELRGPGDS